MVSCPKIDPSPLVQPSVICISVSKLPVLVLRVKWPTSNEALTRHIADLIVRMLLFDGLVVRFCLRMTVAY